MKLKFFRYCVSLSRTSQALSQKLPSLLWQENVGNKCCFSGPCTLPVAIHVRKFASQSLGSPVAGDDGTEETYFGYRKVSKEEKAHKVHAVFQNVAEKYDLMNDLMSAGVHRIWKDIFVSRLAPLPHSSMLDVAGGTGDIAFRIIEYINHMTGYRSLPPDAALASIMEGGETDGSDHDPPYSIVVCDISQNMLDVGKKRANQKGYVGLKWVCGDAQCLPFEDNTFDSYTIAFGMRNVVTPEKALQEARRVLKPGGRFMCLEFSNVSNGAVRWLYDQYSFQFIPVLGMVVAGDWDSYQYLVESIQKFPDKEIYRRMIEDAGFKNVTAESLTCGVAAIHSGFKL